MIHQNVRKALRAGGALSVVLLALYIVTNINGSRAVNQPEQPLSNPLLTSELNEAMQLFAELHSQRDLPLYTPSGRNIFQTVSDSSRSNVSRTPRVASTPIQVQTRVPSIQQQPSFNLRFYGFVKKTASAKQVFVQDGDSIFAGSEGEVVDRHYKIVRVAETSIEVEDLLTEQYQTLQLQEHS